MATNGAHNREMKYMEPDIAAAIRSELCNARRLGRSSPATSDMYVMPTTTIPNASDSWYGAMLGKDSRYEASRLLSVRSP